MLAFRGNRRVGQLVLRSLEFVGIVDRDVRQLQRPERPSLSGRVPRSRRRGGDRAAATSTRAAGGRRRRGDVAWRWARRRKPADRLRQLQIGVVVSVLDDCGIAPDGVATVCIACRPPCCIRALRNGRAAVSLGAMRTTTRAAMHVVAARRAGPHAHVGRESRAAMTTAIAIAAPGITTGRKRLIAQGWSGAMLGRTTYSTAMGTTMRQMATAARFPPRARSASNPKPTTTATSTTNPQ